MKIKRFTTDNPVKRVRVHYSFLNVSEKEFATICKALENCNDPDAKKMFEAFGNLANAEFDIDDMDFSELEKELDAMHI